MLCDRNGIPIGWTIEGADRNDSVLLAPTLDAVADRVLLGDVETIWLDRGYDSGITRGASPSEDSMTRHARKRKEGLLSRQRTSR